MAQDVATRGVRNILALPSEQTRGMVPDNLDGKNLKAKSRDSSGC